MLFQELNKLKQKSIMTSVVLMVLGILMIICPESYIGTVIGVLGSILLILTTLGVLDFLGSNKTLIHSVYLTGWLILGIIGTAILVFDLNILYTVSWLFGVFFILSGLSSVSSTLTYARRSGRKGWWVLLPLSMLMIAFGVIVLINPWWRTPGDLFKIVGVMVLFAAAVGVLRLICIWPIRDSK